MEADGVEQISEAHDENEQRSENVGVTYEEVQQIVSDAVGAGMQEQGLEITNLDENVQRLSESVRLLTTEVQEEETGESTTIVMLDAGQVETAKECARIVCTEGLLVVILLGVLVGLQCFRIFTGRWS